MKKKKYWGLGGELHQNYFNGDVYSSLRNGRPGVGFVAIKQLPPRFAFKTSLNYENIFASKQKNINSTNVLFKARLIELGTALRFLFYENRGLLSKRPDYNVYAEAGITGQYVSSKIRYGADVNWSAYSNEIIPVLTIGLGFTHKRRRYSDIHIQVDHLRYLSDHIDSIQQNGSDNLIRVKVGFIGILTSHRRKYDFIWR